MNSTQIKASNVYTSKFAYALICLSLLSTLILSITSWMHLCSQSCAQGHTYRLYGFSFESVGFVFFPLLLLCHIFTYKIPLLKTVTAWLLCSSLGAEVVFIYVQKYLIGSWCPICLSIAFLLTLATSVYGLFFFNALKKSLEQGDKGEIMDIVCKGFSGIIFFIAGFIIAFGGIGKYSNLQGEESSLKESIAFGNPKSQIHVFIFTDWACPVCRTIESTIEAMAPAIIDKAKLTFVDDPIHSATLNYTPYNLSFMVNNKDKYFKLREGLQKLALDTETPTDTQVESLAQKLGTKYKQLNYADVALGTKYFDHLVEKLNVEGTPTIVIVNTKTNNAKKLAGSTEISRASVIRAIDTLSKDFSK